MKAKQRKLTPERKARLKRVYPVRTQYLSEGATVEVETPWDSAAAARSAKGGAR